MRRQKRVLWIGLAAVMALLLPFSCAETMEKPSEPMSLNLALYPVIPDYESFEETVRASWREKHPETELNFVDWNCYGAEVPEDLDVFVLDAMNLDFFAQKGCLMTLSREDIQAYDDLIPAIMEGCRVDGAICAVPQLICADLLYTRKGDAELAEVRSIDGLYRALPDGGLLQDIADPIATVCLYLQALIDEEKHYTDRYPPIDAESLVPAAVDSIAKIDAMRLKNPEGIPKDGGGYYYAQRFAEGMGSAYIGYPEAMHLMGEAASEMDFRLFSMADDGDIPVFYVDVAAINAHISGEKRALAIELLNLITGRDLLVSVSKNDGKPRYTIPARKSVFDALAPDYPIYGALKSIASTPGGHVFRIKPGGALYMEQAEKSADLLPALDLKTTAAG